MGRFHREKKAGIIVESIELMADKKFMDSYRKAKQQVKNRDFDDWNGDNIEI